MNSPLITIITACFNNESSIEETIISVLSQTYKNVEYIVIDGKSSDKTLEIVNKYQKKISKIISEKDTGIYDALNKGISFANGQIIGFLHADDIFADNNILKIIAENFSEKSCEAVFGDLQYISKADTSKIIRNWKSGIFNYKNLKKGWMPPHPTFYVKKSVYDKYGKFNTNYKISADYDLMMRFLSLHKINPSYIPEIIVKMRVGGKSNKSFRNILLKMNEDLKIIRKNEIGGIFTLFKKNISKIPQFFKK